ncbi:MAG TPA: S8 family serine peptidase [Steroidobacteraceae bacterium]|nr:S8 family serine peptidase [Steroidobacteraceae bacterium]
MRSSAWLMLVAAAAVGAGAIHVEHNPVRTHPAGIAAGSIQNIIVKLRATSAASTTNSTVEQAQEQARIKALAARTGVGLQSSREIMTRLHVIHVLPSAPGASLAQTLARLQADPEVEYAEPDQRRYIHEAPDDPLYDGTQEDDGAPLQQWYEQAPVSGSGSSATPSAVDAVDAWSVTTGSNGVVIADIDTGVRFDHPDLLGAGTSGAVSATATPTGRLLSGYCFITDSFVANGVQCPGPDASDPGDWITSSDLKASECSGQTSAEPSSWHGTRVAGILGALTNNALGMAGMTWNAWILPVRALGVCGGQDSDIETAMLWAGGVSVQGAPDNPYPANIINLSIGGSGSCPQSYSEIISQLTARGVLVVASAGNEGGPVDAPGNCPGVVAVAGLRQAGTKVGYSNLGAQVAVAAPAGNCVNTEVSQPCLYSLISATNLGTMSPTQDSYTTDIINNPSLGTSFSAPIVSGIAALMLAANGNLTPGDLARILEQTSSPFPQTSVGESPQPPMCYTSANGYDNTDLECICTNPDASASPPVPVSCGYGMANASAAVTAAAAPIAAMTVQPATVTPGTTVTLDAAGSAAACGYSIPSRVGYQWSSSSGTNPVSSPSGVTTTVTAPSSGTVTVTLTVTDSGGRNSTATATINSTSATTSAPASASITCLTPITVVSLTPNGPVASAGGSPVAFTASVGDNANTAVTWEVNGVTGGNTTYGTISSSGLYTPPATVPSTPYVTVSAVSVADTTRSGWTQLTVTAQGSSSSSSSSSSSGSSSSSASSSSTSSSSTSSSSSGTGTGEANPLGGKSGGGAVDWITLLGGGLMVALASHRRRRAYAARALRP